MGRYGNYSKLIEDCKTISISKLKEWNYLTNGTKSGVINWSRNGENTGSINIECIISENAKFIILSYNSNGKDIKYKVEIESISSNLGKGEILYFVCPETNKYCRTLYLNNGYFLHRTAFNDLIYSKQVESKKNRDLLKLFDLAFVSDEVYKERYKKYFKTHYKGKPTKKYLKLQSKIENANRFPPDTIQNLLTM